MNPVRPKDSRWRVVRGGNGQFRALSDRDLGLDADELYDAMMALRAAWTATWAKSDEDAYFMAKERFDRFQSEDEESLAGWSEICNPARWISRLEAARACIGLQAAAPSVFGFADQGVASGSQE